MKVDAAIEELEAGNVRFARLITVCTAFFGRASQERVEPLRLQDAVARGPRINVQKDGPQAKKYQVRQVIEALQKLKSLEAAKSAQGKP